MVSQEMLSAGVRAYNSEQRIGDPFAHRRGIHRAIQAALDVKSRAMIRRVCTGCEPEAQTPYMIAKCERHGGGVK